MQTIDLKDVCREGQNSAALKVELKDFCREGGASVAVIVKLSAGGIDVMPEGAETTAYLEYYGGKLTLIVHADPKDEEPTHKIDMGGRK